MTDTQEPERRDDDTEPTPEGYKPPDGPDDDGDDTDSGDSGDGGEQEGSE